MKDDMIDNVTTGRIRPVMVDDDGYGIYLLRGVKVEKSWAADYYLTEGGGLSLKSGRWLLLAVGIGGNDETFWTKDDVILESYPSRCIKSLGRYYEEGAFQVRCNATVEWGVKSPYPNSLLIFIPYP